MTRSESPCPQRENPDPTTATFDHSTFATTPKSTLHLHWFP